MKTESLGECHVKMEAEVRVMDLQGKGCWPSPEARGAGDGNTSLSEPFSSVQFSRSVMSEPLEGTKCAHNLNLDFYSPQT